jgi:hypothetical protein
LLGHTCAKAPVVVSVNKMHKDPNRRTTMFIGHSSKIDVMRSADAHLAQTRFTTGRAAGTE